MNQAEERWSEFEDKAEKKDKAECVGQISKEHFLIQERNTQEMRNAIQSL